MGLSFLMWISRYFPLCKLSLLTKILSLQCLVVIRGGDIYLKTTSSWYERRGPVLDDQRVNRTSC